MLIAINQIAEQVYDISGHVNKGRIHLKPVFSSFKLSYIESHYLTTNVA